ncbi:MAG: hypothetical protein ACHQIK_18890 [Candidatus Acidiferrales bacterium]
MQALEFTHAFKEISRELKTQEILGILDPWLKPGASGNLDPNQKQQFTKLLFDANAGYRQLMTQPASRSILEELRVGEFLEPSRLTGIVGTLQALTQSQQIWNSPQVYRDFFTFGELLRWLLKMQSGSQHLLEDGKVGKVGDSEGIVQLELIEYADETGVSAARLKVFVSTVIELHLCLAYISGLKQDELTFRYLDSGSKFTVAVTCAKTIAETMVLLLSAFWDKFRFWNHDTFDKNIEAASKALTFAEQVQQQIEKKVITPEEGRNFKKRAFAAVEKLTGIGASIPLPDEMTLDRRKLLEERRDTKLLGSGTVDANGESPASPEEPTAK